MKFKYLLVWKFFPNPEGIKLNIDKIYYLKIGKFSIMKFPLWGIKVKIIYKTYDRGLYSNKEKCFAKSQLNEKVEKNMDMLVKKEMWMVNKHENC